MHQLRTDNNEPQTLNEIPDEITGLTEHRDERIQVISVDCIKNFSMYRTKLVNLLVPLIVEFNIFILTVRE